MYCVAVVLVVGHACTSLALTTFSTGMMSRTTVKCESKFIDDDGVVHKEWTWWLKIAKDWA